MPDAVSVTPIHKTMGCAVASQLSLRTILTLSIAALNGGDHLEAVVRCILSDAARFHAVLDAASE